MSCVFIGRREGSGQSQHWPNMEIGSKLETLILVNLAKNVWHGQTCLVLAKLGFGRRWFGPKWVWPKLPKFRTACQPGSLQSYNHGLHVKPSFAKITLDSDISCNKVVAVRLNSIWPTKSTMERTMLHQLGRPPQECWRDCQANCQVRWAQPRGIGRR